MNHTMKDIKSKDDIADAMEITANLARKCGCSYPQTLKLQLVTEEACMNAYEYCQEQTHSSFQICWSFRNKKFEIVVRQTGGTITLLQKNDVNVGLRGRGLTLILSLLDQVEVRKVNQFVELYMMKEIGEQQ
ncbi:ATP-binding protein [Paenibacillus sp. YPG26]|uniref:ATP-binding protein n=1 Tax=Paenibacillus sp. YPG26 TaxID=2878915 RepID=UPI00203E1836|nr:ATP-binding protein [Paenibacillus sp. YPG26]USB31748.1 ATP-binding protein [Paenibacillus sp. YPG26]